MVKKFNTIIVYTKKFNLSSYPLLVYFFVYKMDSKKIESKFSTIIFMMFSILKSHVFVKEQVPNY